MRSHAGRALRAADACAPAPARGRRTRRAAGRARRRSRETAGAAIGQRGIAVERAHFGADRAARQPAAQEIDHERERRNLSARAAGSSMPLIASAGSVVGRPSASIAQPSGMLSPGAVGEPDLAHGRGAQRHVDSTGAACRPAARWRAGCCRRRLGAAGRAASAGACSTARCRRSLVAAIARA